MSHPLGNGDAGRSTAEVSLSGNNLVVVSAQVQSDLGPRVKVGASVDGSAGALILTDRPVLLKGAGTLDGWLVGTGAHEDIVNGSVGGDGTLPLGTLRGVVCAEIFDDIVLNKRVLCPAVDSEVAVAVGVVGTGVVDSPRRQVSLVELV